MSKDFELSVIEKIREHNYDIRYIINDAEPYTLYCASDIAKIIGLKNIHHTIKYFTKIQKINQKHDTNGGKQNTTFLTYNGLLKLICMSKKLVCDNFAKTFGINIQLTKFNTIEIETLQHIKTAFDNEEMIFQYPVEKFRIDLYFPIYKLAIECDEEFHKNNQEKDIAREDDIKRLLNGCVFIRYSPYDKCFNIFKVINKIHMHIMSNEGQKLALENTKAKLEILKLQNNITQEDIIT